MKHPSRQNAVGYLEKLAVEAMAGHRLRDVRAAVAKQGYWEERIEWRIFTVTTLRIEATERDGSRWFEVTVACDATMSAFCPTIERAVEYAGIFELLQQDLFWTVGWPSWVSLNESK